MLRKCLENIKAALCVYDGLMGGGNNERWEVQAAFFPFAVNNMFSMKKTRKSTQQLRQIFSSFI